MKFIVPLADAKTQLSKAPTEFVELFKHGSLSVELYQPKEKDKQQPHTRDEVYVVVAGEGIFFFDGEKKSYKTGDVIFVPAGVEHRFETFSDDFMTWVFFYGPEGGE
jgi:mannose-6-phosphate isomerase-like protein (cupin superfamily)